MEQQKRILVVVGRYYPVMTANEVCAQNLIDYYFRLGFNVDVICLSHPRIKAPLVYKQSCIYTVKPDFRLKLFILSEFYENKFKGKLYRFFGKMSSIIRKIIFFPVLPLTTIALPNRYYSKIKELTSTNKYYGLITICQPLEACIGTAKLKKKNILPIPWVVFCVDTFLDSWGVLHNNTQSKFYKSPMLYKLFLRYCDGYLYMASRTDEYNQNDLLKWHDKLCVADLPMLNFTEKKEIPVSDIDETEENYGYFGSLGGIHYKYNDLLDFFFSLPNDKKRTLHFFSRGHALSKLELSRCNDYKKIIMHGYVESELMSAYANKMNYLISLKYSNQISAKTFQYISFCKPIIHFSGCKDDPDIPYLKQYPTCLILNDFSNINNDVKLFLNWKPTVNFNKESLLEIYKMNTPSCNVTNINVFFERFWNI